MNSRKTGLLIAAALIAVPAMAQDQDHRDHGDRQDQNGGGHQGQGGARPTPPQAQHAQAPQQAQRPQAPQQAQRPPQAAPGAGRGNDIRNFQDPRWLANQGNANHARPTPPQAINPAQQKDRGQGNRGDGRPGNGGGNDRNFGNGGRNDAQQWNGNGHQWNGNGFQGNGDRRNDNNGQNWNGNSHQWNGNGNDRRFDGNRGGGHRPDPNWRNDRRYDWQGWRNSHRDLFRGRYNAPRGYNYRSIYRGFYLQPFFYGSNYWLADPYEYRLPPVEWPLHWVRYYDDAALVDVTSGQVVDVIQGFFW